MRVVLHIACEPMTSIGSSSWWIYQIWNGKINRFLWFSYAIVKIRVLRLFCDRVGLHRCFFRSTIFGRASLEEFMSFWCRQKDEAIIWDTRRVVKSLVYDNSMKNSSERRTDFSQFKRGTRWLSANLCCISYDVSLLFAAFRSMTHRNTRKKEKWQLFSAGAVTLTAQFDCSKQMQEKLMQQILWSAKQMRSVYIFKKRSRVSN